MQINMRRLVVVEFEALVGESGGADLDRLEVWLKLIVGAYDWSVMVGSRTPEFVKTWLVRAGVDMEASSLVSGPTIEYARNQVASGRPVFAIVADPATLPELLHCGAGVMFMTFPLRRQEWRPEQAVERRTWDAVVAEIEANWWAPTDEENP